MYITVVPGKLAAWDRTAGQTANTSFPSGAVQPVLEKGTGGFIHQNSRGTK